MDRGWYLRLGFVVTCVVAAWLALWPSVDAWIPAPEWVKSTFTHQIAPGLDIRGGLRLQYEVEVDEAVADRRDFRAQQVVERLCQQFEICEENEPPTREQLDETAERVRVATAGEQGFRLTFTNPEDVAELDRDLITSFGDLREAQRTETTVTLELRDDSLERLRDTAVEQARETIGNRIDEMGLREASVMTRDTDIIVELPGASEAQFQQMREIIARTARLEFKVVDDLADFVQTLQDLPEGIERASEVVSAGEENPQEIVYYLTASGEGSRDRLQAYVLSLRDSGQIPEDHQLAIGQADQGEPEEGEEVEEAWRTYYLYDRAELTGDAIDDASVSVDPQDNQPYVSIVFNGAGARAFERLTGANVKRRMAIVLDDRVASAPVIQQRIGGGRAQITLGGFRDYNQILNEANQLTIVLRAGALPAPIRPANEQLIGPTLGADSIVQGAIGAGLGVLLVLLFMAFYYQVGGLVADVAVFLNVIFLLAVLAAFEATLTMPGIAGIALTIGMAVDANVLINERIRDEMRLGKSPRSAVELGYQRAFTSIFDSQITTFIAGVVLYQYGSGPIRGFAVTLMIGIVTSLFTGVFCSKVVFDWVVRGLKVRRLPVG
ncbi:protein translocase subunit SecD [Sandaracinus amylolyticus]|uniref:protein translocase subunit SecD n=1 Tax=Sandaracinus amylolyticus TaxID=927083 RepID=UPI001F032C03|nr:protein translocase subunit SecD [Sandaracinus amylolyticus]UJR79780.1 Protein translocase subunit SecD [Sandaracinus amylolyticus]